MSAASDTAHKLAEKAAPTVSSLRQDARDLLSQAASAGSDLVQQASDQLRTHEVVEGVRRSLCSGLMSASLAEDFEELCSQLLAQAVSVKDFC